MNAREGQKPKAPRLVRLVSVEQGRLPRIVTVTGTLAADEEVAVSFKVAGRISEMAVDLGSRVSKDQVIARLDPTDFQLRVGRLEPARHKTRAGWGFLLRVRTIG